MLKMIRRMFHNSRLSLTDISLRRSSDLYLEPFRRLDLLVDSSESSPEQAHARIIIIIQALRAKRHAKITAANVQLP